MSKFVISLAQIKGGVAKTTSVINLGAALVEVGERVLLIDLDPQGSLSSSFGIFSGDHKYDISHVLFDSVSMEKAIQKTDTPGLDIISSSSRLSKIELAVSSITDHNQHKYPLEESISKISTPAYDFVLLDCPSILGVITMNALIASDLLIIPSPPESLALLGVRRMIEFAAFVKNNFNPLLRYRVLLTIYDDHKKIYSELAERLRQVYEHRLFVTSISKDININKSQIVEKPVLFFRSKSKASNQYRALAQEVIDYAQK